MTDSSLWILFFSLFLVLLFIVLYSLLRACISFANRYCSCLKYGKCCCYFRMDWEAYRRERESLHRLRVLRQQHREFLQLGQLSTFSQIPGPIPDSVLVLQGGNNVGFILLPTPSSQTQALQTQSIREGLQAEDRRRVLEQLLVFHPYSAAEAVKDVESRLSPANCSQSVHDESSLDEIPPPSVAFPQHEEPANDNTCAICLDAFVEGELINDPAACRHVFHKECLMGWLDKHDVCPCCRSFMLTEDDIAHAIRELGIQMRHITIRDVRM